MDSCDMLPPGSSGLALCVVPSSCYNLSKLNFFSSKQSSKGHSKDKLQKSKLTDAVHMHSQITNLISSYCKK